MGRCRAHDVDRHVEWLTAGCRSCDAPPLPALRFLPAHVTSSQHAAASERGNAARQKRTDAMTQSTGSRVHLPLLLKKLHELVESVRDLGKEGTRYSLARPHRRMHRRTTTTERDELTCSDGLLSFSDRTENVSREAPFVFRSMRMARSSSLGERRRSRIPVMSMNPYQGHRVSQKSRSIQQVALLRAI